jgi:tol-pal system protein YbgF
LKSFRLCSFLGLIAVVAVVAGCATPQDVRRVRSELDQKIFALEEKSKAQEQTLQNLKTESTTSMAKSKEAINAIQKNQADSGTDITELKDSIQQLRGLIDNQKKDDANSLKEIKDKLEGLAFKVTFLENYLGIGKEAADEKNNKMGAAPKTTARGKSSDKEAAYEAAYASFKNGKYAKARTDFLAFLKQYPDAEQAGNAQFWIGECYYFKKKYEKAIIEYEKVVKNYPEGNKVSSALLKQGLSFQKLGDKSSARLILQQVIKDYPNTNQARIARAKLGELK